MGRLRPFVFEESGVVPRDVLIETGTCVGGGILSVRDLFKQVHTVEVEPKLHARAAKRLRKFKHVTCHLGNSPEVLRRIIDPERETVFWLDSHFMPAVGEGEPFGFSDRQCPVLEELAAIFSFRWRVPPVIMIDDARVFNLGRYWKWQEAYDRAQWPTPRKIRRACPGYVMRQVLDFFVLERA